ncbi:MAG: 50S ribosomal protein L18 [Candidatus Parcubacteria bacterium]|nr:MAG: 50S ribosomal protein L18 [Candidatus Parcubacteria bacterium]
MKKEKRLKKHKRIRAKIKGTADRPRLSVFRTNNHIYVQIINDEEGKTIVSANSLKLSSDQKLTNKEKTFKVAEIIANQAKEKGINKVVFDRGGFSYKGRIKLLAEKLRELGLVF